MPIFLAMPITWCIYIIHLFLDLFCGVRCDPCYHLAISSAILPGIHEYMNKMHYGCSLLWVDTINSANDSFIQLLFKSLLLRFCSKRGWKKKRSETLKNLRNADKVRANVKEYSLLIFFLSHKATNSRKKTDLSDLCWKLYCPNGTSWKKKMRWIQFKECFKFISNMMAGIII